MNQELTSAARIQAVRILSVWQETENFPDRMLEQVGRDHAFTLQLVYGVVRFRRPLHYLLKLLVERRPHPLVESALHIGLLQLLYLKDVQDHAAINETVDAVKALGRPMDAPFVNAVLREAQRRQRGLMGQLTRQKPGIALSHPDQLVHRWKKQFGIRRMNGICEWNNQVPQTVIRLFQSRTNMAEYQKQLSRAGVEAAPHPFAPRECLSIQHGVKIPDLPGFREGLFSVQDPATLAAPRLLKPVPGEKILDGCAAPGGKAMLMADLMGDEGSLTALELHRDRMERLEQNLTRAGFEITSAVRGDAASWAPGSGIPFDGVLLDVPCSNTGVIRRRPDVRWRFSEDRLKALNATQRRILDHSANLVRPGGRLVYSTCSIEPEENEELVLGWLKHRTDYRFVKAVKLIPGQRDTDGAYAALLVRSEG